MRQTQTRPNSSSSSSKSNVVSGKVTNVSQRSGSTKRIQSEPVKCAKKRKLGENSSKGTVTKHQKESDVEKTQKKYNPGVVKKTCVNVKRLKKPNEKFKKVDGKQDKKTKTVTKVLKKCKGFEKVQENEGPPTLCETFSRITTMVAETVINEKENQKLSESLMGKTKKDSENSPTKNKGDLGDVPKPKKALSDISKGKKDGKKSELTKKMKAVMPKQNVKIKKPQIKKLIEKTTLDNTENLVKVLKDEEISLAFGKGIGTRRKSTAGSVEGEAKVESTETKSKSGNKAGKEADKKVQTMPKKLIQKKKIVVKKDAKAKIEVKKAEEMKKATNEKEEPSSAKDKKAKKEQAKAKVTLAKKNETKSGQASKKKLPTKEAKSPKPKLGSETDGSNSDELTLNIIQKKTKKTKTDGEKSEAGNKNIKTEPNTEEVKCKSEDKAGEPEKITSKSKKTKTEKEDKDELLFQQKIFEILKDKKKSKETESDTEEEFELRRILAKKFGKNVNNVSDLKKKKKQEAAKSGSESDQRARRLKLFGFWSGPKRHRVASLNALAKVHCLYENESKGVLVEMEKTQSDEKEKKKSEKKTGRKSGKDSESEKLDSVVINKRILRGAPGTRGAGKHWDMFAGDSTTSSASSDESHSDTDKAKERRLPLQPSYRQKMQKKETAEKEDKTPKRRRNTEIGITMDLKDMVVRKRMASLNASAILAASYSSEKRSNRKDSSETSTEDGMSSVEDNEPEEDKNRRKSSDEKPVEEKKDGNQGGTEIQEYKHKKHFWKTKVESLKKLSKEKRNSPSPILADFGLGKDLSTTVLEKEKNDELNDDKEKDKKGSKLYLLKKYPEGKPKGKVIEGEKKKNAGKDKGGDLDEEKLKRKHTKRKLGDAEMKTINMEKMSGGENTDEYEYKSDSDNGQRKLIELRNTGGSNKKVAVIVNQDTDVTITGVYVNSTRSTHHEGFCSIAGMQYRISSTSHTQTEATAVLKTSTASEQTPPPTEPTNCTSPRNHKSYTPLSALSNMQPPAGAPPHPHLPPPPHHHHHLCGMGQHRPPPDHYMSHGPISHQGPISPLGRRHGCSSAFSAPHCSSHPGPGGPSSPAQEGEGFGPALPTHGYFQPAGPLIHHPSSNSAPIKSQNLASLDSTSTSESQAPASSSDEPSESSARSGDNPAAPPQPPPPAAHHMGYPRGYPPYQGGYYQGGYYPPSPQAAHYQPPPPPPSFHQHYHHHQDLCYPPGYPPSSYPPPPGSYRRFLQPAPSYYSPELTYGSSGPPPPQDHGGQQMVVPGGPSSSYSAPLDSYPPPTPYYPGYSTGPSSACYSHPPSSRNLAFIEQTYQSCPCPMQLCPKNVHIGPLTGECKRPSALPLPPVALQLPQEPPGAAGPPSPARGSAGMPPQPSPVSNSARPNCGPTWDGKPVKSTTDIKWEESKTNLEFKPSKYKAEVLNYTKEIWDLSNRKSSFTILNQSVESADQWEHLKDDKIEKESETFVQGLLAISSNQVTQLTERTQEKDAESVEEKKKIKTETVTPPVGVTDPPKEQKNILPEDTAKRNKSEENNTESKKRKRKSETGIEDAENKVKKVKKCGTGKQKDENACADKVSKKNQKTNSKAKLLKDRNETVAEEPIPVQRKEEEEQEEVLKREAEKIISRRKSNQDRSGAFPEGVTQALRKSKSCSPARSKLRETSLPRELREDTKRKEGKKSKAEGKVKVAEHSKKGGRKSGVKGKPVSILSRYSSSGAKKRKSEGLAEAVVVLKKSRKPSTASPRTGIAPKWSNGWSWDSESFHAKVYLTNDEPPVMRKCYTAMRHVEGDVIHPKDCILLKAGPRRIDLPFVAKVAALWENPDDGEMMVSLLWYYRPEHTDQGRQSSDQQDEIFASRHKDINSVACIEDKCFVLTYNEYCRYRKKVRRMEEGVIEKNLPVPRLEQPYFRVQRQPPCVMAPDMVFFCRRVYDFRQKRLLKNPT